MTKQEKKFYSLRSFFSFMARHKVRFGVIVLSFAIADAFLAIIPLFIGRLIGALSAHPMQGHQAVIYVWLLII